MIRISNKIKTLLAMLSFVQVTSGCDATVQDIIIDTDPGVEIGNNDYYTWCKETLSVIDKDLKISGTHSYYENQDRSQVSFIWGNIFLLYTYTEGISLSKSEWSDALMNCFLNLITTGIPTIKVLQDMPLYLRVPRRFPTVLRRKRMDSNRTLRCLSGNSKQFLLGKSQRGTRFFPFGRR